METGSFLWLAAGFVRVSLALSAAFFFVVLPAIAVTPKGVTRVRET
jgi:hypothetical protein